MVYLGLKFCHSTIDVTLIMKELFNTLNYASSDIDKKSENTGCDLNTGL